TLAVQLYTSSLPRRVWDFHPLERAHGAQTKKRKPDASDFLRLSPKTSAAILTFKKNTNRLQLQKTSRIRMNFEIDVQIRVTLYGMQIFLYVLP
ncbi:hypothetical protein SAMN02910400_02724, partial [Lachnospiraceae bacterium C10]